MKAVWTLLSICVLCVSCERDADIPLPKTDPKLGLFCFLSPNQPIEVVLVRVIPLFGSSGSTGPEYVLNAQVWISNGSDTSLLERKVGEDFYTETSPKVLIEQGKPYWIWAEAPGLPAVSASCTVPPDLAAGLHVNHYGSVQESDSVFHLSMIWQDIPGEENYYRIYAENIDSLSNGTTSTDVYSFNTRYYSDFGSDGETLQSGIGTYSRNPVNVESRWIFANLITCESNYYRYHLSVETNVDGNPLLGPSSLFSNVTGGVGCFGAYLLHTDKIRIF
ncbi:MAG: DUF4249 domain-containing protein [Bacteroidia bacterium]